jgi:predicted transcriptional regulator
MNEQPDNAKHPNTEALITRAIETCGLTQKEIATICNVQQSVVSGWKSGKIAARWKQIRPLIEKYGDVQGEKASNTYCRIRNSSFVLGEGTIEYLRHVLTGVYLHETSLAAHSAEISVITTILNARYSAIKKIIEAIEERGEIRFEAIEEIYEFLRSFIDTSKDDFLFKWVFLKEVQSEIINTAHKYEKEYVKIYGETIFEYVFYEPVKEYEEKVPWMKWAIISSTNGLLTWVISKKKNGKGLPEIDQNHEPAIWISEITEDIDAEKMVRNAEVFKIDPKYERYVNREILSFSLIRAFSQNGYALECVKTIGKPSKA